jgi:hypothetical protein
MWIQAATTPSQFRAALLSRPERPAAAVSYA